MDDSLIKVGITFGGVILGFTLSQVADFIKNKRHAKSIKKSVRYLVYLEIKKNYRLLSIYWRELNSIIEKRSSENDKKSLSQYGHAISEIPFPLLSKHAWEANIDKIAGIFTYEQISKIWDYYEDLNQLKILQEGIVELKQVNEIQANSYSSRDRISGSLGKAIKFSQATESPVSQFKLIIEGVVKHNSPEDFL